MLNLREALQRWLKKYFDMRNINIFYLPYRVCSESTAGNLYYLMSILSIKFQPQIIDLICNGYSFGKFYNFQCWLKSCSPTIEPLYNQLFFIKKFQLLKL